jgi:peptidoglycan/xylan/chitin deacetylase (PgdA/CDA1 family)
VIRRLANRGKDLLFVSPLDRMWIGAMRGAVTCFLYHRVGDGPSFLDRGGPAIAVAELERDLHILQSIGVTFMTFEDLRNGHFPAAREIGVIISFDDCLASNYTVAAPLLERAGARGTFFQITSLVDSKTLLWEHALYFHAARVPNLESLREETAPDVLAPLLDEAGAVDAGDLYPTSAQLREARQRGHEIGSHGHRHYKRSNISDATFESELAASSSTLESILGEKPLAFSYPFNSYLPGDDAICARHFSQAVTVDKHRIDRDTNPLWLPRFTWPGPAKSALRQRRWLLTGRI